MPTFDVFHELIALIFLNPDFLRNPLRHKLFESRALVAVEFHTGEQINHVSAPALHEVVPRVTLFIDRECVFSFAVSEN